MRKHLYSLWAETKRRLLQSDLSLWYSQKNWFLQAVAAKHAGENQEDDHGFTCYFHSGIKASMLEMSEAYLWMGWLKILFQEMLRKKSWNVSQSLLPSKHLLEWSKFPRGQSCRVRHESEVKKRSRRVACPSELLGKHVREFHQRISVSSVIEWLNHLALKSPNTFVNGCREMALSIL